MCLLLRGSSSLHLQEMLIETLLCYGYRRVVTDLRYVVLAQPQLKVSFVVSSNHSSDIN